MIVRPRMHWLRMLFVWRGSVAPRILPRLGFFLALACVAVATGPHPFHLKEGPLGLLGVALAIFLGFRNSTAYDRFWEGRKLWGSLLIVSRSFMRQALTLPSPALSLEERREVTDLLRALPVTLNHQLRGTQVPLDTLTAGVRERVVAAEHRPARVVLGLAERDAHPLCLQRDAAPHGVHLRPAAALRPDGQPGLVHAARVGLRLLHLHRARHGDGGAGGPLRHRAQ